MRSLRDLARETREFPYDSGNEKIILRGVDAELRDLGDRIYAGVESEYQKGRVITPDYIRTVIEDARAEVIEDRSRDS